MKLSLAVSDLAVRGGTHKQVLRLAQFLAANGDEVEILTADYDPSKCYPEFSQFAIKTPAGPAPYGRFARIRRGIALARMIDPSSAVLNLHDLNLEWTALAAMVFRRRIAVIWQINDLHPAFRVGPFARIQRHWTHWIHRYINRFIARRCRVVTVNVSKNRDRVSANMGVDAAVYYPGVDRLAADRLSRHVTASIEIVSIGVVFRYRNYEAILGAMAVLRNRGIQSRLTIVGETRYDPEYASEIRTRAERDGLSVDLAGQVSESRLEEILRRGQIFVFVNVDQSWGLAVFEAMSMSLPVVLSKSVGAVELLRHSRGVEIVDPEAPEEIASALAKITASQMTYDEYARAAFDDVQEFTWDKLYSRHMRREFATAVAPERHGSA